MVTISSLCYRVASRDKHVCLLSQAHSKTFRSFQFSLESIQREILIEFIHYGYVYIPTTNRLDYNLTVDVYTLMRNVNMQRCIERVTRGNTKCSKQNIYYNISGEINVYRGSIILIIFREIRVNIIKCKYFVKFLPCNQTASTRITFLYFQRLEKL